MRLWKKHCHLRQHTEYDHDRPVVHLKHLYDLCLYGHLKFRQAPLFKVIVISWGIAFFEYCFQVPANRIGSYEFSTFQLRTLQEVITLPVFSVFSVLSLDERIR